MNFIKKMTRFIKNIFIKQEKIKKLEESKISIEQDKELDFAKSIKITPAEKSKSNKIEVLICEGDGLGIQGKINF